MREHAPKIALTVFLDPDLQALGAWLGAHCPAVAVVYFRPTAAGFAVKAEVIMEALERWEEVTWIDSDIIVRRDFSHVLASHRADELLLVANTKQKFDRASGRTTFWGYQVVRSLDFPLNTCIVGVSRKHLELLRAWKELMDREVFRDAQKNLTFPERPAALASDQDVLEGLLVSDHPADYGQTPYVQIPVGRIIVHENGPQCYSVRDRVRNTLNARELCFTHLHGTKPWLYRSAQEAPPWFASSCYLRYARAYEEESGEPVDAWLQPCRAKLRWARWLTFNHPHLQGAVFLMFKAIEQKLGLGRSKAPPRSA